LNTNTERTLKYPKNEPKFEHFGNKLDFCQYFKFEKFLRKKSRKMKIKNRLTSDEPEISKKKKTTPKLKTLTYNLSNQKDIFAKFFNFQCFTLF
jgi:hypothetical protein